MLEGLHVVEVGTTVAASAAGAVYQRLGATVTNARLEGDSPGNATGRRTQRGHLIEILDRGKTTVNLLEPEWETEIARLAQTADVIVYDVSYHDHYWQDPPLLEEYEELVDEVNTTCWVTISPYGLRGPLSAFRGSELTFGASGGIVNYMRTSTGRPMKPAGFITSITAGHLAVLAGLHGLLMRRSDNSPVHLDLSIQDTVIVTGVFLECAHLLFECGGDGGAARYAAPRGLITCGSGMMWLVVIEDHQWQACIKAMGDPPWTEGILTAADRQANYDKIQQGLSDWASAHDARSAVETLQHFGVPATVVNSCGDLLNSVGHDVRPAFFLGGIDGDERVPDVPFEAVSRGRGSPSKATEVPEERRRFRVVDLTQVLVGPLATSWMGAMGIDVLKIEDPDRMDVYRRNGPFLQNVASPERGAYYALANYSKRSHALHLNTPHGRQRLDQLISSADLVVHNLGRRAASLGITPERVHGELGTPVISCSGFGQSTGHAAYRAYGMNIQAAGGLVYLSRDRAHRPVNLGTSWADASAAVWLAILASAQLLTPEIERSSLDLSMVEVVAHQFKEYFSSVSMEGAELVASESRMDHAVPHGLYKCSGKDQWIALAVESDEDWLRLLMALGNPHSLTGPRMRQLEGRRTLEDDIDLALGDVFSSRDRPDLFRTLQAFGVACAPVWGAADLVSLDHLHARGLFQTLQHSVWSERQLLGLPWRVNGKPTRISVTPLLGEHTSEDASFWWGS